MIETVIRDLLATHPLWSTMSPREINSGDCEDFMLDVCTAVPEAEERTTRWEDPVGHYWIEHAGRHYDAEAPEGVDSPGLLPVVARSRR